MLRQNEETIAILLFTNEIPANRVVGRVDWRGPASVQNGGDLPWIDSFCPHLHIHLLVYFHFNVGGTGEGVVEVGVLVGDHSRVILPTASWKLLPHNAMGKNRHMMVLHLRGNNLSTGMC